MDVVRTGREGSIPTSPTRLDIRHGWWAGPDPAVPGPAQQKVNALRGPRCASAVRMPATANWNRGAGGTHIAGKPIPNK